jgi:hypothetical protein
MSEGVPRKDIRKKEIEKERKAKEEDHRGATT